MFFSNEYIWVLAVPYIEILLVAVSIALFIFKQKKKSFAIWFIIFFFNFIYDFFAIHPNHLSVHKNSNDIRIMTYNILNGSPYLTSHEKIYADELLFSIKSIDADVLCFNELYAYKNTLLVEELKKKYPYSTYNQIPDEYFGTVVFSKYPIDYVRKLPVVMEDNYLNHSESLIMNIETPEGEFMLSACHFSSNNYLDTTRLSIKKDLLKYLNSISYCHQNRVTEAKVLRDSIDKHILPCIVMGDFNEVGGSQVLAKIKASDLADAWWEGGFGYGHTYHEHGLFFRLDHILYSKENFKLKGVKVLKDWKYSDHYPLVVDLELK